MLRLLPRADDDERRLAELELWAVSVGVSAWVIDVEPYEPCRVAGIVQRLRLDPARGRIEATISDGTGVMTARWPIRRVSPELRATPGRAVILQGVPLRDEGGGFVLVDPTLELVEFRKVA